MEVAEIYASVKEQSLNTILYVEDDADIQAVAQIALESWCIPAKESL